MSSIVVLPSFDRSIKKLSKMGLDIADYSPIVSKKEGSKKRALYKFEKKDATPVYFDSLS